MVAVKKKRKKVRSPLGFRFVYRNEQNKYNAIISIRIISRWCAVQKERPRGNSRPLLRSR